jgi:hypothetical protein
MWMKGEGEAQNCEGSEVLIHVAGTRPARHLRSKPTHRRIKHERRAAMDNKQVTAPTGRSDTDRSDTDRQDPLLRER